MAAERSAMSAQEKQARAESMLRLANKLIQAAEGASHDLLLDTLLSLYASVASQNTCCTASAA